MMHNTSSFKKVIVMLLCMLLIVLFCADIVFGEERVIELTSYNETTGYSAFIKDNANILNENEEKRLLEQIEQITQYGDVVFITISDNPYPSTDYCVKQYANNYFTHENGILFMIDMDYREIYIFSRGEVERYISSANSHIITDNVYSYATDGEYYLCCSKAFDQIYTLLKGGRIAKPMKYISNLLLAFVGALLINYFVVMLTSKSRIVSRSEILAGISNKFSLKNIKTSFTYKTSEYSGKKSNNKYSSSSGKGQGNYSGNMRSGSGGGHRF